MQFRFNTSNPASFTLINVHGWTMIDSTSQTFDLLQNFSQSDLCSFMNEVSCGFGISQHLFTYSVKFKHNVRISTNRIGEKIPFKDNVFVEKLVNFLKTRLEKLNEQGGIINEN